LGNNHKYLTAIGLWNNIPLQFKRQVAVLVSNVFSFATNGIKAFPVNVESDISRGLPDFEIIGLGDASIKESRKRIWTAIKNQCFDFPVGKVIINLAPASMRKVGTTLDLAIAISILTASGVVKPEMLKDTALVGELSLEGNLLPVKGILPMVEEGKKNGVKRFIIPRANVPEGGIVKDVNICGVSNLRQAVAILSDGEKGVYTGEGITSMPELSDINFEFDFGQIAGQHECKRALEIAVSGCHNIIMLGSAGSGKSLLASCVQGIMPPMDYDESYENTAIYSIAGKLEHQSPLSSERPFRRVHGSVTLRGLTGGGRPVRFGEVTLANNGVLFFDEITEADRRVVEALREPLENRTICLSSLGVSETLPADFLFVAAGNPCKCGRLFEGDRNCSCNKAQIKSRLEKLSLPLLERIDMHLIVRGVGFRDMSENIREESSSEIRKRVIKVRTMQKERYKGESFSTNGRMNRQAIEKYCSLSRDSLEFAEEAVKKLNLSMRSFDRLLRVSRTIADMEESLTVQQHHLAEAFQYRAIENVREYM